MKKKNQSGFVLAETLVVTVFLMVIFANIYTNFFPLIGEYEKREYYDDIDSKYSAYWIKKMVESNSFTLTAERKNAINNNGYYQLKCSDFTGDDNKTMCKDLASVFQVNNCDTAGNNCSIYITNYQILDNAPTKVWFKNVVKTNTGRVFTSGFQEYIVTLPDYISNSVNGAKYRVFVVFHNRKDANNYYSYATMEVVKD